MASVSCVLIIGCSQDVRIYRYYRDLIKFRERGDPGLMLKCINPAGVQSVAICAAAHLLTSLPSHATSPTPLTSPHLTYLTPPHLTPPHLTSPHLTYLTPPHLTSPHLSSPRLTCSMCRGLSRRCCSWGARAVPAWWRSGADHTAAASGRDCGVAVPPSDLL